MVIGDQHGPFLARQQPHPNDHSPRSVDAFFGAGAAEHERPGIGRVGQEVVHRWIGRPRPGDPARSVAAPRQQQPVLAQGQQHLAGRAEFVEPAKHRGDRLDHRLIRRDDHPVVLVVVQPDRQALPQLSLGGLVLEPRGQPGADEMKFSFGHRALEAEDEAVVEAGGVVDAIGVGDQGVGQGAQVQQLVPVGVVAGQPGHLDAQHDADFAQPHVGDQIGEPEPPLGAGTGPAQVGVDDHHLVGGPAQPHRAFAQLVLPFQALGMHLHLGRGGLAYRPSRRLLRAHRRAAPQSRR
jgi:hypothetical protein